VERKHPTACSATTEDPDYPCFWETLAPDASRTAVIDARKGQRLSYRELVEAIAAGTDRLRQSRKLLICIVIENDISGVLCYLSALSAGHAVLLGGPNSIGSRVIAAYRPDVVIWSGPDWLSALPHPEYPYESTLFGYRLALVGAPDHRAVHKQLALLLSTSGCTGSPKVVRLSYRNLAANAWQIGSTLLLSGEERAALSLPLYYVYGLSMLHSAIAMGGTVVVNAPPVVSQAFWRMCASENVTILPVVPSQLRLLRDATLSAVATPPALKLTVSGAPMDASTRHWIAAQLIPRGVQVYSMYGMTEASGRISVLPPSEFVVRPTSVGQAVPRGRLDILATGEIVYSGPNVMLGYADGRGSLQEPDDRLALLHTGDAGALDAVGNLYVTGRFSRFCKVHGIRINLDDLEQALNTMAEVAVVSDDAAIFVFCTAGPNHPGLDAGIDILAARIGVPRQTFVLAYRDALPKATNGKTRYAELLGSGSQ
jgi:long-chain acyl-CoA synthetase